MVSVLLETTNPLLLLSVSLLNQLTFPKVLQVRLGPQGEHLLSFTEMQ